MKLRFKRLLILYLACMAAMHIFVLFSFKDFTIKAYNDFAAFYTAGMIVKEGQSKRLYDLDLQRQMQAQFATRAKIKNTLLPYIHPPFEAQLFSLLAYLKYRQAYLLWTGMQLVFLGLAIFLLMPDGTRTITNAILLGFLGVGLFPTAMALLQGQDSVLLLLIFSSSLFSWRRMHDFLSGSVLAVGLIKFHLVIPIVLIFLLRRRYKFVLGFALVAILLLLLSAEMVGWSELMHYPRYLWTLDHTSNEGITALGNMPNIRGVLASIVRTSSLAEVIPWLSLAVGIIFTARSWHGDEESNTVRSSAGFSLAIIVSMITSYYVYSYEMILLLIPLIVLGKQMLDRPEFAGWPRRSLVLGAGLLFLGPVAWLLILRTSQFCWYGCAVLLLFLISLTALLRRTASPIIAHEQEEA